MHQHTGSFVYQCAKGKGFSIIAGQRYEWEERDIFCIPSWAPHCHGNASGSEDAVLFSFHDLPVIQSLGLYQERDLGG
jgi:gentisate 1,2-dioxygenase